MEITTGEARVPGVSIAKEAKEEVSPRAAARERRLFAGGMLAVLILAAAVRLYGLGAPSFDCDELYSVRIQGLNPSSVASLFGRSAFHDLHPPLSYYVFLAWNQIVGVGEEAVRALPVLWGLVSVLLIGLLGRRLGGSVAGLAVALLLAFSPLHIAYSQEARPYAQAVTLSLLAHLFLLRSLAGGRRRDLLGYAVSIALAIYSHYFALLALAPHALVLLWLVLTGDADSRRAARQAFLACTCGFATFLGWVPALLYQMSDNPEGPPLDSYELGRTLSEKLARTLSYLRDFAGLGEMPFLLPALLTLAILLAFAFTSKRRLPAAPEGGDPRPFLPRWLGAALLISAVAGAVLGGLLVPSRVLPTARETLLQLGYSAATVERELRSLAQFVYFVPAAMAVVGFVVLAWGWLSALLDRLPRLGRREGQPLSIPALLGILFLIPALATLVFATGGARFVSERNLLLFLPPLTLAAGLGLGRLLARRTWRLAVIPLLVALAVSALQYQPVGRVFGRPGGILMGLVTGDWQGLAGTLAGTLARQREPEHAPLVTVKHSDTDPALFYLKGQEPQRFEPREAEKLLGSMDEDFRYLHVVGNKASDELLAAIGRSARLRPTMRHDQFVIYEVETRAAAVPRAAALGR